MKTQQPWPVRLAGLAASGVSAGLSAAAMAALMTGLLAGLVPAAAQAQEAGAVELELWRAASKIDQVAAYQAYLAQYPKGVFAPLAQLAIAKLSAAPAATPAAPPPAPAPVAAPAPTTAAAVDAQKLARLKTWGEGHEDTGAIEFSVGSRFTGPGVMVAGWIGAKRQLLLPRGEWLVVAAYDHRLGPQNNLTTVAFGRLNRGAVDGLLTATFNGRPLRVDGRPGAPDAIPVWPAVSTCDSSVAQRDRSLLRDRIRSQRWCAIAYEQPALPHPALFDVNLTKRVDAALGLLELAPVDFRLRAEAHYTDRQNGTISYAWLEAPGAAAPAPAGLGSRAWLERFLPAGATASDRDFEIADLSPGKAPDEGRLPEALKGL